MAIHTRPDDKVKMYCLQWTVCAMMPKRSDMICSGKQGTDPDFFKFLSGPVTKEKIRVCPLSSQRLFFASHCRCNRYGNAGLYPVL